MSAPASAWPSPEGARLDPADVLTAARFGDALVYRLESRPANDAASWTGTMQALVDQLQQIGLALQARHPAAIRRRAGWLGRLLGRDLEMQAQAEQLAGQLGVVMLRADAHANHLRALAAQGHVDTAGTQAGLDALDQWITSGQAAQPLAEGLWRETLLRRLEHLRRLATVRRLQIAQSRLLYEQALELLERYQRIRDILLPTWRQQALTQAATPMPVQLCHLQRTQDDIAAEVAAMHARLR